MSAQESQGSRICIGLLSGTSADAIDAAVVRIAGCGERARLELLAYLAWPFPPSVRQELFRLFEQAPGAVRRLTILHRVLGELFAEAAREVCVRAGIELREVFVIGSHGQTVWHQPEPDPTLPFPSSATLQIGDPAVLALRTGVPVVSDFRAADIAVGGQGAPLTPYLDWVLLRHPERNRAVQNLGGIANVTYLPAGAPLDQILAFDTGPGNVLIDSLVQLLTNGLLSYDQDGRLAAAGKVDEGLLAQLHDDPYLQRSPPKTTGRERYGVSFARQLLTEQGLSEGALVMDGVDSRARQRALDLLATATAFTASSVAEAYRRWLPVLDEVIVSGGGSRNPVLLGFLRRYLSPLPVLISDEVGIDSQGKEAILFALLAHDACFGLPTNVPRATGAAKAVTLGSLTPPLRGFWC